LGYFYFDGGFGAGGDEGLEEIRYGEDYGGSLVRVLANFTVKESCWEWGVGMDYFERFDEGVEVVDISGNELGAFGLEGEGFLAGWVACYASDDVVSVRQEG
jgi:hypothetical protein